MTIWTIPAMKLSERLRRTRDWAAMKAAGKLPKRIKYWAAIQSVAAVTMKLPDRVVGSITVDEILGNLDRPKVVS